MDLADLNLTEKDFENIQKALKETVAVSIYRKSISHAIIRKMFNSIIDERNSEPEEGEKAFEEIMKELEESHKKETKALEEEMETLSTKISLLFEYMKAYKLFKTK